MPFIKDNSSLKWRVACKIWYTRKWNIKLLYFTLVFLYLHYRIVSDYLLLFLIHKKNTLIKHLPPPSQSAPKAHTTRKMYVTRSLSMYRKSPNTLSLHPPDAPYSGHLVVTDEEAEAQDSCCWGICNREQIKQLPFPQDKILTVVYTSEYQEATTTKVWFIPVLDQPLSSNCYYVIKANGRHKGYALIILQIHFVNFLQCTVFSCTSLFVMVLQESM